MTAKPKSKAKSSAAKAKKPAAKKTVKKKTKAKKATGKVAVKKKVSKKKVSKKTVSKKKVAAKKTPAKKTAKKKVATKKAAAKKTPKKKAAKSTATKKKAVAKKKAPSKAKKAAPATKPQAKKAKVTKSPAKKKATPKTKPAPTKVVEKTEKTVRRLNIARMEGSNADFVPYSINKNEDYMNEDQRAHFRQILLDWKMQLMEEVDRTVTHMKDEAGHYPDPADRASQEEEFSLELRTRDRERKLIKKIDSTLDLIDQNDYGYCNSCGIEIGVRRLEARPTARQCIDCKTLDEIKERQILG